MKKLKMIIALMIAMVIMCISVLVTFANVTKTSVYVDAQKVSTGEESFWAWIWSENTEGHWEPLDISETGLYIVNLNVNEKFVVARIRSGEQPDWSLVWNQTEDMQYTGEHNCVVLSFSNTIGGKMTIKWKTIKAINKNAMIEAMREAEKYLYEESDKYTAESLNVLMNAYYNAQSCYESATTQEKIDEATDKLNQAISQLVLKDEPVTVDKTLLRIAIDTATSYYMSLDKFTDDSWNTMQEKLAIANALYNNENATQSEVDLATQELKNAIDSLERVEDLIGDVDGDGVLSVLDATCIQRYLAMLINFDDNQMLLADTNEDGCVSIIDATYIQWCLAKR